MVISSADTGTTICSFEGEVYDVSAYAVPNGVCSGGICIPETPTPTPTRTPTNTPEPTKTSTVTPSITKTPTITPTITKTQTITPDPTKTPTPTITPTKEITPSPTTTPSITPAVTKTPTVTQTSTPTGTITQTPTKTIIESKTPTPTITKTPTITPTNTKTPTLTPTNTPTNTKTPTLTPTSSCGIGWTQGALYYIIEFGTGSTPVNISNLSLSDSCNALQSEYTNYQNAGCPGGLQQSGKIHISPDSLAPEDIFVGQTIYEKLNCNDGTGSYFRFTSSLTCSGTSFNLYRIVSGIVTEVSGCTIT